MCISEDIQTKVLVLNIFSVMNHDHGHQPHNISVKLKDWETIARKDRIEGIELEFGKLEGTVVW
jgi:hypothetical protein